MEKEISKRGRPKFKFTDEIRNVVKEMASMGVPQEQIAAVIGCSIDTMTKNCYDEVHVGRAKSNFKVAQTLYGKAVGGDTQAAIFWLKTQARWKETSQMELTGKDDGPIQISEAKTKLLAGLL